MRQSANKITLKDDKDQPVVEITFAFADSLSERAEQSFIAGLGHVLADDLAAAQERVKGIEDIVA